MHAMHVAGACEPSSVCNYVHAIAARHTRVSVSRVCPTMHVCMMCAVDVWNTTTTNNNTTNTTRMEENEREFRKSPAAPINVILVGALMRALMRA